MAEVLLFHHILGRTAGMEALAERFRAGGHTVHLPDLFEGRTFADRDEGRAYVGGIGFDTVVERGRLAAQGLPRELVHAGVSIGALPAQVLTQTRLGARAAILVSATVEPGELDAPWPAGVPAQMHLMEGDPLLAAGDLEAARGLVETLPDAELHLYPGDGHLFTEAGGPAYDEAATDLVVERALGLLARLGAPR